ncbi:hypothetical protein SADUNF_Sadunf15G0045000 [Salix dunnii]|uniref:cDENN domain-containing protein n=1 Tax=Salix dunnii TaxID=1413687 RepID=A0A835MID9_9ROSI|nr:hypothetical protein SADUNF_Sadunf15G0045000 [Salix dunnii]
MAMMHRSYLGKLRVSFHSMVQYLDVDNLLKLLTAVLLERRFYFVPTTEPILYALVYQYQEMATGCAKMLSAFFTKATVYLQNLDLSYQEFQILDAGGSGVYRVDPPTPYMMGLHSSVDTPYNKRALKLPWLLGLLGERGIGYDENNYNRHDKLQDAIGRGQNTISILPSSLVEPKFLTISDPYIEILGSDTKITYDRFLSSIRSKEQEERRKQIFATTSGAFVYRKYAPSFIREGFFFVVFNFSHIPGFGMALIESNAERIGGNGFIDGWHYELTDEQFVAVKELMYKRDANNVSRLCLTSSHFSVSMGGATAYNMARRGHLHQQELTLEDSKLNPLPFSLSSVYLPSFGILRTAVEDLFALCFSPAGSSKPLWDVISYMVSNVPMPTLGKDLVLFAIENCLLFVEAPPKDGLPHVEVSFQSMVQYLDVDNLLKLLTAVLLERRFYFVPTISDVGYSLLTLASNAICHLIYPFRWQVICNYLEVYCSFIKLEYHF